MGLNSVIDTASSGLRATQAGLDVVSQNVANAGSTGYTRRVLTTSQVVSGNQTSGVAVTGVQRTLDTLLQRQLRLENAGAAYTGTIAAGHQALDAAFDQTSGGASLSSLVNTFASSLQALSNSSTPYQNRSAVVSAASDLAGSLNSLSTQVQDLRQNAETTLGQQVSSANDLLQQISGLNATIVSSPANASSAALLDQRDAAIDQLSSLVDLKVTQSASGSVSIATTGGLQLFDGQNAVKLSFDARSPLSAQSGYSRDPSQRSVGTITATDSLGRTSDVIASGGIKSGSIAANIELRDDTLPQAQSQLDAIAAALSSSLSDKTVAGTAATSGAASGYDVDLASLQSGNSISLNYTDASGAGSVTFVKVTDPSVLPLPTNAAGGSGRTVGIDFSGGAASVATQIQAALGSGFSVSNPAGSTLRILDGGATGTTGVTSLSTTSTVTGTQTGDPQLPLFVDGGRSDALYTGSLDGAPQFVGYAGRITINPAVAGDPSTLVAYTSSTAAGDTIRPSFLSNALTGSKQTFPGSTGIGSSQAGYSGTIVDFAQQVISKQAADAASATNIDDGQQTVLNSIQSRFSSGAGVSIDTELTQLIQLQTAYSANARILTAAKDLNDILLNAVST